MDRDQLKVALEKLHTKKIRIGELTYGQGSRNKYCVNNLAQKISETTSFLLTIDLPNELAQARKQTLDTIETAFGAIQQEYAGQKPDERGHEVVTETMDSQSTVIRQALSQFDAAALSWLSK